MSICQFFGREPPTVVRMTHVCMLICQKELTHLPIHWLMSPTCGRLAPMRSVSFCAETHVCLHHALSLHRIFRASLILSLTFLLWPIQGYSVSGNLSRSQGTYLLSDVKNEDVTSDWVARHYRRHHIFSLFIMVQYGNFHNEQTWKG